MNNADWKNMPSDLRKSVENTPMIDNKQSHVETEFAHAITELLSGIDISSPTLINNAEFIIGAVRRHDALWAKTASVSSSADPELYTRINITKGAKGEYRHETTVSVKLAGGTWDDMRQELEAGLRVADQAARDEIEQRIAWDQHPHESDDEQPF